MRTMRMEREDIENSLKVLSHIVDDDFIITVDEARKIIGIYRETSEALQAEVRKYHDAFGRLSKTAVELEQRIVELKATQPHWVSVEDELPPPNKTVLVCKIWGDVNGEPHKVITMDSFTISPSDSVIAWMPLPEPPQEVQDGQE